MMKFSIIVPVKNKKPYIAKCINSLLNQDYTNFEVILVDNNSNDGSTELLEKFKHLDSRLEVISVADEGVSRARNAGLKRATGKYILFIDSDDTIDSNALSNIACAIRKANSPDILFFGIRRVKANGKIINKLSVDSKLTHVKGNLNIMKAYLSGELSGISACNKVYSAKITGNLLFNVDVHINEDKLFLFDACRLAKDAVKVVDTNYNYYIRNISTTTALDNPNIFDMYFVSEYIHNTVLVEYPKLAKVALEDMSGNLLTLYGYMCKNILFKRYNNDQMVKVRNHLIKNKLAEDAKNSLKLQIVLIKYLPTIYRFLVIIYSKRPRGWAAREYFKTRKEHRYKKTKILIITQRLGHNYGGLMQAYALQKVLKNNLVNTVTDNLDISRAAVFSYLKNKLRGLLSVFSIVANSILDIMQMKKLLLKKLNILSIII